MISPSCVLALLPLLTSARPWCAGSSLEEPLLTSDLVLAVSLVSRSRVVHGQYDATFRVDKILHVSTRISSPLSFLSTANSPPALGTAGHWTVRTNSSSLDRNSFFPRNNFQVCQIVFNTRQKVRDSHSQIPSNDSFN